MKLLVTGGAGFIGSNFIRLVLAETGHEVVNLDALTYAGNLANLLEVADHPRYRFIKGDVRDLALVSKILAEGVEAVVNFAAESHVDRSIADPQNFLSANLMGTAALLEAARNLAQTSPGSALKCFLQVSTDEVYGSLGPEGLFREGDPLAPNSPYAASKAGADLLARAYHRTFGLPVLVTRSSNNYGPYQFPEKALPLFITNLLEDRPIPLYGDGLNRRDWIHVEDNCRGILLALEEGRPGEVYNLGGDCEIPNLELVERILKLMKKPRRLLKFVADRPGHDRRYALDSGKIERELGFSRGIAFDDGLRRTVEWYSANRAWWQSIKKGEYREYYEKMYGERLRKAGAAKPGKKKKKGRV